MAKDINKEIVYDSACDIYYIGEFLEHDKFNLVLKTNDDRYLDSIVCYTEDKSVIEENSNVVNDLKTNVVKISSSHIEMSYYGNRKNIAATIPYDEGWKVYNNGSKIETYKNWNNFLSFKLEDTGEHEIKLVYRPGGFSEGLKISIVSAIILILYEVFLIKRNREFLKLRKR